MKKVIEEQFDLLHKEFEFLETNQGNFPIKQSFCESPDVYVNVLSGKLSTGTVGSKTVYVNEGDGILDASIAMKQKGTRYIDMLPAGVLTVYRTALLAAYAIKLSGRIDSKIGIIGGGKINMVTVFLLKELGATDFVLIGGRHNVNKNEGLFSKVLGRKTATGHENIKKCKTLIVCTNNISRDNLIGLDFAPEADMVIAQDNGYTLSKAWRTNWKNFSDYPDQLSAHFTAEFPYDNRNRFKNTLFHINRLNPSLKNIGVYLYGTIIADLVTAEYILEHKSWWTRMRNVFSEYYPNLV